MVALASVVSRSYLPGLQALARSIQRNGHLDDDMTWVFLTYGKDLDVANIVRPYGFRPEIVPIETLKSIPPPGHMYQLRFFTSWYKLYLLGLDDYDLLASIDLDMVCLGDMRDIYQFEHLSAPPDMGKQGDRAKMIGDFAAITTAFAIFKPDVAWLWELEDRAISRLPEEGFWRLAEMSVLNDWLADGHQDIVHYLPESWATHERRARSVSGIKLLHMPGATKWWEDGNKARAIRALVGREDEAGQWG